mgnify:CR=1 FL=1
MLWLYEIIIYTIYMYGFVLFSILFKPSLLTSLIFFIYCICTTWNLFNNCNNKFMNNIMNKIFINLLYSSFCLTIFYLIHSTWNKYKNNLIYQLILLGFPIYYYFGIKTAEKVFNCDDYHTIFYYVNGIYNMKEKL